MSTVAYLVVANPSNKNNLGTLIRCAAAFAAQEVVVVGAAKWSTHGAHGSNKHMSYRWFGDWTSAANYLRTERRCDLCAIVPPTTYPPPTGNSPVAPDVLGGGVLARPSSGRVADTEIATATAPSGKLGHEYASRSDASSEAARQQRFVDEYPEGRASWNSTAVRHRPFRRSTAFLVGHRNRLEDEALELCDFVVHVEQAKESPVELEPPVTTAIALHHFTAWAHYEERTFEGEKFQVNDQPVRCRPPTGKNAVAEERLRVREELRAADPLIAGKGYGSDGDQRCSAGLGWLAEVEDKCEGSV